MADDGKRLRQTLEDVQGRARQLERIADRHVDRIAALEAEVKSLKATVAMLQSQRQQAERSFQDSERAFAHTVTRLSERDQVLKAQLKQIRQLEALVALRTKELARAERRR